jgi:hypothetical protein
VFACVGVSDVELLCLTSDMPLTLQEKPHIEKGEGFGEERSLPFQNRSQSVSQQLRATSVSVFPIYIFTPTAISLGQRVSLC